MLEGPPVITAIVSPGYAPLEQYAGDGNQGPWSDIYALACVMYRAVTNENPPDAVTRMKGEETVARKLAAARERYSERFVKAVELGMTVDEKQRPQSLAAWREAFAEPAPAAAPIPALAATGVPRSTVGDSSLQAARRASGLPSNRRTNAFGRPLPQEEDTGGAGKWLLAAVIGLALIAGYLLTKRSSPAPVTTTFLPSKRFIGPTPLGLRAILDLPSDQPSLGAENPDDSASVPPSTPSATPLMASASSEARNRMVRAT